MYSSLLKLWRHLGLKKHTQMKVMRMVNDKFLIGVTGVIFNENHEVLLVEHTYRRVPWSLPGGFLQSGEHPKEGLEREVFEETGFKVHIEKIIKTQHDEESAKLDMCFIGTYIEGTFKKNHEVVNAGFFARNKLPPLIDDQYEQIDLAYKRYRKTHARPFFAKIHQQLKQFATKLHFK